VGGHSKSAKGNGAELLSSVEKMYEV